MPKKRHIKRAALKKSAAGSGPKRAGKKIKKKPPGRASVGQAREQRLSVALEAAHLGVWEWDPLTNEVFWSENVHFIFGLPDYGFDRTFETYLNLVYADDRTNVLQQLQHALDTKTECRFEHRLYWPDGTIHWIESIGKVTGSKRNKTLKITGTIQDVTGRKTIEKEREDWKTRHELVSTSAGLVIYDYDIPSGSIVWSGNSRDVLGYKAGELGNIDRWLALIHPDDREEAFALLEESQEKLTPYDVRYRFRKKKGGYIHMRDRGFFLPDTKGKARRMLGMMQDISEAVKADQTISENTRYRKSIESTMPDIVYVYDYQNKKVVYANRNIALQVGYTPADLNEMGSQFLARIIHPDDLVNIQQWGKETKGTIKEAEYRILTKNGSYRWFLTRDTPFRYDEEGNVLHLIGIAQDITEKKDAINQTHRSEQSYRELFDTVGEAIFIQDRDGKFLDINAQGLQMFGHTKSEMVGKTVARFGSEEKNDYPDLRLKLQQAMQGQQQTLEFWAMKKDGTEFLLELRLTKGHYFESDTIIATGRDITQRRLDEQALRESELRFRTLQEASSAGIGIHDKGIIIDCNQGLCDMSGYTYDELIGFDGIQLVTPDFRELVMERIRQNYDKPYDVEGLRKNGTKYHLEVWGKNIPYHGRTVRITEFRNVSDRKHSEQMIMEQNAKLQAIADDLVRKNNQLEEFTQIVSHNLRAPVGNMITLLSFHEAAQSDVERREYFALMKEASATTLSMLNDVNDVLKIKQDKNIGKQHLRFETILHQVSAMLSAKIAQSSARIIPDFTQQPDILYPAIYLESIMLNLLDNALKYAHPDRAPEITLRTYKDAHGSPVLEVSDNGLGINLAKYGHYLFKLRKTFHVHPESRGIGLFMIKNQVETMGGDISVTSKENEGSTFFVNFNKFHPDAI